MVKRMWKATSVYTYLFLLSFTLTFGIAYYGMSLEGRLKQMEQLAGEADYGYRNSFYVFGTTDTRLPGLDSGIICYMTDVFYEDIVERKSAYVVMEMNDILLEPLAEGEGFVAGKEYGMPQCICGRAWQKYMEETGEKRIISLNGRNCEVAGILEPNGYEDSDWRLFLYEPSLQHEFVEELFGMGDGFLVDYRTKEPEGSADTVKFTDWIRESFQSAEPVPNMDQVDGSINMEFKALMSGYRIYFVFLIVFCFFDCAFLTYVWCMQRLRENMLKRVFGFSMGRIWLEGMLETVAYEAASLLLASVFCFIGEAVRGNMAGFFLTWKYGAGLMGLIVLLFTLPLSVINILYLEKVGPADTLKAVE